MQPWEPFTVYTMAPSSPAHPLLSPAWGTGHSVADIFGDPSRAGKHLVPPSVFCKAGLVGEEEVSLLWAGGGGPGLQRQVGAVVPRLPHSAVISRQSPLQVGHGHSFLEVNHGIGV